MRKLISLICFLITAVSAAGQTVYPLAGNDRDTGWFKGSVKIEKRIKAPYFKAASGDTMVICADAAGNFFAIPIGIVRTGEPSGGGGGTTYYPGYAIKIEGDTIKADTAALSGYFVRDKDSTIQFVTPTQFAAGLATKANTSHTHAVSDVINLQTILNSKLDSITVSNDSFYTWKAGVRTFLYYNDHYTKGQTNTLLSGKSDIGHTHTISNIDGLTDTLKRKPDTSVTNNLSKWVHAKTQDYDTITVFSNNFNTGSVGTGFSDISNNSSYTGGKLTWTNTQDGLPYGNYIRYDQGALSENYIMSVSAKFTGTTDPARGLAQGLKSLNPFGYTHTVISGYDSATGKLYFWNGASRFYSTNSHTMAVGDSFQLIQQVKGLHYYITLVDYTGGWTLNHDQVLTPSGSPFSAHNAGNPVLHHIGGDYQVFNWSYKLIVPHNLDLVIKGNSIVEGQAASEEIKRWASQILFQDKVYIAGGGADAAWQNLQTMGETFLTKPKAVLIFEGNDILFGTPDSAWQATLLAIHDTCVAKGVAVYWAYPTPRNSTDMRGMVNWLDTCSRLANDLKIDLFRALKGSGAYDLNTIYDSGDGLHLNDLGHQRVAYVTNVALQNRFSVSVQENYVPKASINNTLTESPLYISPDLNVGINTTSPQYKLDVNGVIKSNNTIFSTYSIQVIGNFLALPGLPSNEAVAWGNLMIGYALSAGFGNGSMILGSYPKGKAKNMLDIGGGLAVGTTLVVDSTVPINGLWVEGTGRIGLTAKNVAKLNIGGSINAQFATIAKSDTILVSDTGTIKTVIGKITKAVDTTITGDWTYSIGAGIKLISITVYTEADETLNIGTTSGGGQILPDFPFVTHQPATINTGEVFALSSSTTIYFTGGSGSIRYILKYE